MRVALGLFNQFSSRKDVREKPTKEKSYGGDGADLTEVIDEDSIDGETGSDYSEEDPAENDATVGEQPDEAMQVDEARETMTEKDADQLLADEPAASKPMYDSPFNPAYYPSPWPLIPCTNDTAPPTLQQRLALHLLRV